jgi:hypothetical protein
MPMKRLIIAALAGCAGLLVGTAANALTFTYSGQIDSYAVQTSGWYQIDAWGAQGGGPEFLPNLGGLGAMVGGRIYLNAGQILDVVVGGQGKSEIYDNTGGGGGGGSFVYVASDLDLLLAAGGGGGSDWLNAFPGGPGLAGRDGGGSGGGVDGMGGSASGDFRGLAGGGAGWLGPGANGSMGIYGLGGSSAPSFQGGTTQGSLPDGESEEGPSGGFGGGGGASYNEGGGGGGYSGGGAGILVVSGGGGGGSYIADQFYDFVGQSGVNAGNGQVTIDQVPIPEPPTWAMMLLGFLGLGSMLRLRRRRFAWCAGS